MTARLSALPERIAAKIDASGDCWLWTGARSKRGYANVRIDGQTLYAHRVVYQTLTGPIPRGLFLDHVCHVKHCVNPGHLRAVTRSQNGENRIGPNANSSSGVRNVYGRNGRWEVAVGKAGRLVYGGTFTDIAEAERAAIALRNKLFTHNDADRQAG